MLNIGIILLFYGDVMLNVTTGLAIWLDTQRVNRRRGKLLPEREAKLQILVDAGKLHWGRSSHWDSCFDLLIAYGRAHADCNVPRTQEQMGTLHQYYIASIIHCINSTLHQ